MFGRANSLIIVGVLSLTSLGVSLPHTQFKSKDLTGVCPENFKGLLPHPSDCTLFYNCNYGQTNLLSCPANLHFNPATSTCDWPWNVPQCGQGTKPPTEATTTTTERSTPPTEATTTTTERPAPPETEICRPGFFGYQNLPENCNYYVVCADGTALLRKCESGASFDIKDATCKDSSLVDGCGNVNPTTQAPTTVRPSTTTRATTTSELTEKPTTTTGAPTRPTTTTTQRTTTRAPTTTTTTTRRPTTTTAAPGQFPCPAEAFIYMPHPSDCNKFYLCRNGNFISVYNCGFNLWFNPSMQVCQNPWGSTCR